MIGKLLSCAAVLGLSLAILPAQAQPPGPGAPELPPARKIPGITVEDPFPNACTDCHLNYVEQNLDVRFSTLLGHWSHEVEPKLLAKAQASAPEGVKLRGRHPEGADAVDDVPGACLECHGRDSKRAPPFAVMIHNIHLTGGQENHFLTLFQGECTYCHKLDLSTGAWSMPSGAEP